MTTANEEEQKNNVRMKREKRKIGRVLRFVPQQNDVACGMWHSLKHILVFGSWLGAQV